jgi:predicted transposase YdaD
MPKSPDETDIFDRSFKLIIGNISNRTLITLINALFGANHPPDSDVRRLNTEQIDKDLKKQQADEIVSINGMDYLIEEQTADDANMAIRIFEYCYAHALRNKSTEDGVIVLPLPRAVVIYLEAGAATPDELVVRLEFPDGGWHDFKVKTMKLLDYGVDELAERGFVPLLPFYIIKLRKAAKRAKRDEEKRKVEEDFKEMGLKIREAIAGAVGRISEEDAVTLLERLSHLVKYVGEGYSTVEVRKMLSNSVKGYGPWLVERGEQRGEQRGELRGKLEGERIGELRGKLEAARNVLNEGLSMEQAARITGIPADELLKQLNKAPQ